MPLGMMDRTHLYQCRVLTSVNPGTNPTSKKTEGSICKLWEGLGKRSREGLHLPLDSKEERSLGKGGKSREELHTG